MLPGRCRPSWPIREIQWGAPGRPSSRRRRYNLGSSFVQGNARKTKESSLDFLAFPWSNRDFQWVMTNPNKKNRGALNSPPRLCSPRDPRRQVCLLLRLGVRVIFRQREYIIIYFYLYKENAGLGEGPAATKEGVMAGLSRLSTWFGAMTARAQGPSHPKDWATAADLRLKCVRSLQAWTPRGAGHGPIQAN